MLRTAAGLNPPGSAKRQPGADLRAAAGLNIRDNAEAAGQLTTGLRAEPRDLNRSSSAAGLRADLAMPVPA